MGGLGREWVEALRSLRRAPAHAALCAVLLTIGLASTTAISAVSDGLLRRPLPVESEARLIVPYGTRGQDERLQASALEAEEWRRAPSLEAFAVARPQAVTVERDGEPERLGAAQVEASYFSVLGVRPVLGRGFSEADARTGARRVVLGFGFWQRRFGGDPGVVGEALRIDGEEWEVGGVMPRGFDLPLGAELWQPLHLGAVPTAARGNRVYDPVARLAPGRSLEGARTELATIAERLADERPDTNAGWGVRAIGLRRHLLDDPDGTVERALGLVSWGAVLLLLIACADVAQLQSVRAASRLGELGTRLALGGSRTSLARSLVFETLALAGLAALLSVPLARALAAGLLWLFPPPATAFTSHFMAGFWEPRILGGVAAGALATGLLAAAYPACRLAQTDVAGLLAGGHRASPDRGSQTFLEAAVLAQVAVTVLLLTATATLAESYALLRGLDVGFRPEGLSYYALSLAPKDYPDHERRAALAEALVESLGGQDGIRSASFTTNLPLASPSANWIARHGCEGRELAPGEVLITADRLVGTGYLELLGVRLLAGRTLSARDTAATEPVAVINQSLADECWPRQDPIGKRVLRGTRAGWLPMTVVGVVADLQEQRVSFRNPHRVWYLPYRQHDFSRDLYLVIRGDAPPAAVRSLVRRLDPHQPVTGPRLVTEHLEEVTGSDRLAAALMGYFAAVGLLLAGFGIHGSMRRFVGQQQRAIGIRMALGAGPRRILAGVLGRGLTLAATGAAIGAACALALQPLGAGFVHATLLGMPARVGATAIAILALAAAVCAAPAQRASRIDPARLLR